MGKLETLRAELEKAREKLHAKGYEYNGKANGYNELMAAKPFEIAYQDVIEKIWPDNAWWQVTGYWDIFDAMMGGLSDEEVIDEICKHVDKDYLDECKDTFIRGAHVEKGHNIKEYLEKFGDAYDDGMLWDYLKEDFEDGKVDTRKDIVYWYMEDLNGEWRYFETSTLNEAKEEKKLDEGTSNFGAGPEHFPLLVFYTYDEYAYNIKNHPDYPQEEQFEDEDGNVDYGALEQAQYDFEEKAWEDEKVCILDEDKQEELENKLYDFNEESKRMAWDADYSEEEGQRYENNLSLEDVKVSVEPGYYSAAYIDVEHEDYLEDLEEDFKAQQMERFTKLFQELKSEFGLTELSAGPMASNGERGYSIVNNESLDEAQTEEGLPIIKYELTFDDGSKEVAQITGYKTYDDDYAKRYLQQEYDKKILSAREIKEEELDGKTGIDALSNDELHWFHKLNKKMKDSKDALLSKDEIDKIKKLAQKYKLTRDDLEGGLGIRGNDYARKLAYKSNESLDESMESEVTKWWKDVEDANKEMKWNFNIDNGDYSDSEAMHAAMFDMLDDLKEKGASDLFNRGKKIYNKYAKYSKYNEDLQESNLSSLEKEVKDFVEKLGHIEDVRFEYIPFKDHVGIVPFNSEYDKIEQGEYNHDSEDRALNKLKEEFEKAGYRAIIYQDRLNVYKQKNESLEESCSDKELVDKLVAFGTCDSEEEAEKRVARMSQEMKDEMCKSLKRQAQDHLLNDSLNESDEVARVEYCVMDKNNNNIECFDNTDDAIAFAKEHEGIRVLEVQYGPKDENGDEQELGTEEVWSIRESLKEAINSFDDLVKQCYRDYLDKLANNGKGEDDIDDIYEVIEWIANDIIDYYEKVLRGVTDIDWDLNSLEGIDELQKHVEAHLPVIESLEEKKTKKISYEDALAKLNSGDWDNERFNDAIMDGEVEMPKEESLDEKKSKKKYKIRYTGDPAKDAAFFNHAMGSDKGGASVEQSSVSLGEGYIGQEVEDFLRLVVDPGMIDEVVISNIDADDYTEAFKGKYEDVDSNLLHCEYADFDVGGDVLVVNVKTESDDWNDLYYDDLESLLEDYNGDEIRIIDVDTGETLFEGDKEDIDDEVKGLTFWSIDTPKYLCINAHCGEVDELEDEEDEDSGLQIEYWMDEESRDQGLGDLYFDNIEDIEEGKEIVRKMIDKHGYASAELQDGNGRVIFGYDGVDTWGPDKDESLEEGVITTKDGDEIDMFDTYKEAHDYLEKYAKEHNIEHYDIVEDNYEVPNGLLFIEYDEKGEEKGHYPLVAYKNKTTTESCDEKLTKKQIDKNVKRNLAYLKWQGERESKNRDNEKKEEVMTEDNDVYALHLKVIDANTGKINKIERIFVGSKKECDVKKKQLEDASPEDANHNKNVYKVSKVK